MNEQLLGMSREQLPEKKQESLGCFHDKLLDKAVMSLSQ